MNIIAQPADPRINELLELEQEEGQPLALRPETIILLEDAGWVVEPFTAQFWRDPAFQPDLTLASLAGMGHLVAATDRATAYQLTADPSLYWNQPTGRPE